ncbi:MAG: hypothetical protein SFV15_17775 [Polyangiaceae bacterium]|nr:hypothetical protein [Polyangiaceae bacterium]
MRFLRHSASMGILLAGSVSGCHAGLGPVFAYRAGDGPRLGWEAKGGHSILSVATGQAFSLGEGKDTVIYAAGEPGLLLGATLGFDKEAGGNAALMSGAWLGAPVYPWDAPRSTDIWGMQQLLTLAIGYRYAHGNEFYLAPKYFLLDRAQLAH